MATAETPLLECVSVSKAFGAVQALYRVDFEVRPGEVMALVGDNGAGKSTLIKSVVGIYPFDEGEVRFEGEHVHIHGPRDSAKLGIEVVYQDLALADNLDVVANMFLGRERVRTGVVLDESSMERSARETLDSLSVTTLRSGPPDGSRPVRRSAAGGRGGEIGHVGVEARHPRRAHGGSRRGPDAPGAGPRPPAGRARPGSRDGLPQPARRLRMRGSDHRAPPRSTSCGAGAVRDDAAGGRAGDHGRHDRHVPGMEEAEVAEP